MTELVIERRMPRNNSVFALRHIPFFNWRMRSLARGTLLAFVGIPLVSMGSDLTRSAQRPLLIVPLLLTLLGTLDTSRCMRKRWDFYHAGVLLLLYADLMAIILVCFALFFPYLQPFGR